AGNGVRISTVWNVCRKRGDAGGDRSLLREAGAWLPQKGATSVTELSGKLEWRDLRLGFVVSRFNGSITERLLAGALDFVQRTGGSTDNVTIVRVPGSFEIPIRSEERRVGKEG